VAGYCEQGNEISSIVEGWKILDNMCDDQLLTEASVPHSST